MIALSRKERRRRYDWSMLKSFPINSSLVETFLNDAHNEGEQARFEIHNYNQRLDRDEMSGWNKCIIFPEKLVLLYREHEWTSLQGGEELLFIGETAVEFLRFLKEEYPDETVRVSQMITEACAALEDMKKSSYAKATDDKGGGR